MATVTNNMTRIHDAEGALTTTNLPSGGPGATANTDIFLQAAQSLGKRVTETAGPSGFLLIDGADNDCSAANVHVGFWFWITHYGIIDDLRVILATGIGTPTAYDSHTFPFASEYPKLGGWVRTWVDISRTPENIGSGGGLNKAALRSYGIQLSFTAGPGGSAANVMLDSGDFVAGAALSLAGTAGLWTDFTTADQNSTNQYGVFRLAGGVYNCFARVQLGTSSSLVFNDSNFTVVFPNQDLVAANFMGINVDLQNASTNIDWSSAVITSSGARQGDIVVTGTSGTFDAANMTFSALRIITLTSVCNMTNSTFVNCGQITAPGSTFTGNSVSGYTGAADTSALVWNAATDPNGELNNTTFTKGSGTTHAIEFGTSSPTSMTLTNVNFSGYNAADGQNDSAIHIKRTTGTVTINITGGNTPSYKSDGATVVLVAGSVTVTLTAQTAAGAPVAGVTIFVKASDGTGPFPYQDSVTIVNSGTTATVTHASHGLATNDKVYIEGASLDANLGVFSITVTGASTYTYTMGSSPGSSPTGTITSTFVILSGSTNGSGQITMSRVFPSNQPFTGWARKSTTSPYYKTGIVSGTVSSTTGATPIALMISDE